VKGARVPQREVSRKRKGGERSFLKRMLPQGRSPVERKRRKGAHWRRKVGKEGGPNTLRGPRQKKFNEVKNDKNTTHSQPSISSHRGKKKREPNRRGKGTVCSKAKQMRRKKTHKGGTKKGALFKGPESSPGQFT